MLGLGSGWNRREFDAFGIPYDKRVSRFEEAFTIIRGLLAGERVTFDGTYHRADDAVLLPTPRAASAADDRLQRPADAVDRASRTWTRGTPSTTTTTTTPESFARLVRRDRHPGARDAQRVRARATRRAGRADPHAEPVRPEDLAAHLRAMGEAGADEVILVASPINEESIRVAGRVPDSAASSSIA